MVNALMIGLLLLGGSMVFLAPWIVVVAYCVAAKRGDSNMDAVAPGACLILCIFEVASAIDWAMGWPSKILGM